MIGRLRTYFLTGVVVAAPIGITIWLTWWFVSLFDTWIKPFVPAKYNPDTYLPVPIPGFGLVVALIVITLIGALAANLFGRTIISYWEHFLNRMPVVRNVYKALKQIFQTALSQSQSSFRQVGVIQYPRKGLYALVFISRDAHGEIVDRSADGELVSVFLPTTPNPTSGFLLFVPKRDIAVLDMSVEDAAKLIISAGLVLPDEHAGDAPAPEQVPALTEEQVRRLTEDGSSKDAAE
ncbi:DUF502 domain-containing protein [Kaustia mangrovi]|uniref:DUF502 domain-containing protein n=1 Tax=Kaustia mangrovi TaxID=2593653 RepID=UPI0031B5DF78